MVRQMIVPEAILKTFPRRSALATLFLCIVCVCLAACSGRPVQKTGYHPLILLAQQEGITVDVTDGEQTFAPGRISGAFFAQFLDTREWEPIKGAEVSSLPLTLESEASFRDRSGTCLGTLRFWRDPEHAAYYASAAFPEQADSETDYYSIAQWDDWTVSAMAMLHSEEGTLRSPLPGGGEMVLVCSGASMSAQNHWLFYTEDGEAYTLIDSNLDTQYRRVAEHMVFSSRDVGFVPFRFEDDSAPTLYRTEDGGVTWQRVHLPMEAITTENGYTGIHVTDFTFEDEKNGSVTVSMYLEGQEDLLSCVFTTTDAGKTWSGISTSHPLAPQES